jgi:hypothetical protein
MHSFGSIKFLNSERKMIPFSIWSYVKPAITTQQKRKKNHPRQPCFFSQTITKPRVFIENLIYTKASGLVILREVCGYVRF